MDGCVKAWQCSVPFFSYKMKRRVVRCDLITYIHGCKTGHFPFYHRILDIRATAMLCIFLPYMALML